MLITGNLLPGIMPKQLLPVILAFAFASSCTQEFLWQDTPAETFAAYRQSFEEAAGKRLVGRVTRTELLDKLATGRLLWLGDHHRHSRLHGLQTELLQQLQERGVPLALGLEAIGTRDQRHVDDYLAGEIDMATLRERMRRRWSGSWLDDRELDPWFFRSLLEFARRHAIPVFALEPTPRLPLELRDPYIARSVQSALEHHASRLVVVVIGQTHLLGTGDVTSRTGQRSTIICGKPTPLLATEPTHPTDRGDLWQTDTGTLWFTEMFRTR